MAWRELLQSQQGVFVLHPPALPSGIDEAERDLGVPFPADLKGILLETDGIEARLKYEGEPDLVIELVWPLAQIVQANRNTLRFLTEAETPLLLFGDTSDGDGVGYRLQTSPDAPDAIATTSHEDGNVKPVCRSLYDYLAQIAESTTIYHAPRNEEC